MHELEEPQRCRVERPPAASVAPAMRQTGHGGAAARRRGGSRAAAYLGRRRLRREAALPSRAAGATSEARWRGQEER